MHRSLAGSILVSTLILTILGPGTGQAHAVSAGACTVQGTIYFGWPLSSHPRDSSYSFDGTVECEGTADISGTWDVDADGDTTGVKGAPASGSGETCTAGHSDGPGEVSATGAGSRTLDGSIEFQRVGPHIDAWGSVVDQDGGTYSFRTELVVISPSDFLLCPSDGPPPGGLTQADVLGVLEISDLPGT